VADEEAGECADDEPSPGNTYILSIKQEGPQEPPEA